MLLTLAAASLIGLSLGLLGSGGSILTVPVLTLLVGQEEKVAIAGSLAVVGTIALAGAIPWARQRQVDGRSLVLFGLPGMAGAWIGAWASQFVSGAVQLTVFAVLMLAASILMFRPAPEGEGGTPAPAWLILLEGLAVGAVTGFVGVGGGFLIIPALVVLGGLPMHKAVGTSLGIIALKSFTGFWKYRSVLAAEGLELDYATLALVAGMGILGGLAGQRLGSRLPQAALRRVFAVFLVVLGVYLILRHLPEVLPGEGTA